MGLPDWKGPEFSLQCFVYCTFKKVEGKVGYEYVLGERREHFAGAITIEIVIVLIMIAPKTSLGQ